MEIFGDSWSLLIIRDIVFSGKRTFGEFLDSEEHISPSVLANRLANLEISAILAKKPHETDHRKEVYFLTEKGLDLIPILLELTAWGAKYDPETLASQQWIAEVQEDRERIIKLIRTTVKSGGSVCAGPNCVNDQLEEQKFGSLYWF
ncbi:helix-turn-helix domain-containing protein [Paenibacillus sp. sptzw28]|uniref:winged helix-turn-helix transcriptional regulator n=1 Tax=Paenibacillus sp. sptzw28 TaxID=715179 RepID=UPI002161D643|nr:helix-turn-helix domain-containing protein [Paenibacillus sp. sptzw28]